MVHMNNAGRLALGILFVLLVGAAIWYLAGAGTTTVTPTPTPPQQSGTTEYRDEDLGIIFSYPDAYELETKDLSTSSRKHASIILTRLEDLPAPEGGEGPPTINIDAYQNNLDKYTLDSFVRGTSFTNFKLSPDGAVASTTVNGMPAVMFRWSGLYEGTTYVVARDAWVYTFSVTSLTPTDEIVTDFVRLLDTVEFLEE
jgi:hypothetical protein